MKVSVSRAKVRSALERCDPDFATKFKEENPKLDDNGNMSFDLNVAPKELIDQLMLDIGLPKGVRGKIVAFRAGPTSVMDMPVKTVREAFDVLTTLMPKTKNGYTNTSVLNLEVQLGGRWYPAAGDCTISQAYHSGETYVSIEAVTYVGTESVKFSGWVSAHDFKDDQASEVLDGGPAAPKTTTVRELLSKFSMRPRKIDDAFHAARCARAKELNDSTGRVIDAIGDGLFHNTRYWWSAGLEPISIGSKIAPSVCVVDADLERGDGNTSYNRRDLSVIAHPSPFIRAFCLASKKYVYIDIDDVQEHKFDENALGKLILPEEIGELMNALFSVEASDLFGDLLADKHGGMIICAAGPTGTGKTMTAECFSQHSKRPLYSIALAELGTDINSMEQKLQNIFTRAKRWNAVLLLDEADILFAKRDNDLERAAIVGIFLRLLDYHSGFLFITTNRPETIDEAFAGRITITVVYPKHDVQTRMKVWTNMLSAAGLDPTGIDIEGIAQIDLNGRQVRNAVRLLRVLYGKNIDTTKVHRVAKLASREVNVTNGSNGRSKRPLTLEELAGNRIGPG